MRLREHALPRRSGCHGDTEELGQLTQLCLRLAHAHAVPRNDHRLLCLVEQPQGLGDALGAGGWPLVGEVSVGVVQPWRGVGPHGLGECPAVVEHGYRAGLSGQSMLNGKLGVLHGSGGLTGHKHAFRVASDGSAGVPGAVITSTGLIGTVVREGRTVAQVGKYQHWRARQIGLHKTHAAVGEHEGALAHAHAGSAAQASVNVGHDCGQALFAHQHATDGAAVVIQCLIDGTGTAAGHAEHKLDARLFQHASNRFGDGNLRIEESVCHESAFF